jgi:NTP pyrophosphatase (non-canonical NTP hydrolase)
MRSPEVLLISITEELGEVAADLARERYHGVVAECLDVAASALLLALKFDKDGSILRSCFSESP